MDILLFETKASGHMYTRCTPTPITHAVTENIR
jgi:hypothetical protein